MFLLTDDMQITEASLVRKRCAHCEERDRCLGSPYLLVDAEPIFSEHCANIAGWPTSLHQAGRDIRKFSDVFKAICVEPFAVANHFGRDNRTVDGPVWDLAAFNKVWA